MDLRIGDFEESEQLRSMLNQDIIPKLVFDENKEFIVEQQERLREIEKQLRKSKGKERVQYLKERLNCQQNLKEFVVSIRKKEYENYMKKIWENFGYVVISKYERIPIMDCYYDEKGYYPLNYEERKIEDEVMMV